MQLPYAAVMGGFVSPAGFGQFARALVFQRFGTYFAQMGVTQAVIQRRNLTDEDGRVGFTTLLLLGVLLALAIAISAPLDSGSEALGPVPAPEPELPSHAQWRGVLHSDYDIELWRSRRSGHAFSFDWNRIVTHKNAFMSNPGHQLNWDGSNWETTNGCVNTPQSNYQASLPPHVGPRRLRDAAFYALVAYDAPDAAAVRQEVASRLVSIAAINNHNMSNRTRFCYSSRNWDLPPYFDYATWWSHIFLAYDFVGREAFTANQRQTLDRFFYHAADAYRGANGVVNNMTGLWGSGRFNEPPSWNFAGQCSGWGAAWDGGPQVPQETTHVTNRKHFNYFPMTAIAIYLKQHGFTPPSSSPGHTLDQIIAAGRALAYETIAVYWGPNALFSELHRANPNTNPHQGIFYQSMANGHAALQAEMFARLGDTAIIDYHTTAGVCGWDTAKPKTLGYAARSIAEYHDRQYPHRRWNNVVIGADNTTHVADAWTAITNAWWNDDYVRKGYMRQNPNNRPWPSSPSGLHGATGWEEPGSTLPAVLFMFGLREGDRTVYP